MTTTAEAALRAAVEADPDDNARWLVLADALGEAGDEAGAAYCRWRGGGPVLSLSHCCHPPREDCWPSFWRVYEGDLPPGVEARWLRLLAAERELDEDSLWVAWHLGYETRAAAEAALEAAWRAAWPFDPGEES